ncbi:PIG-L family deacetylase [Inquilinus sp. CAU 1745]|uniref:PIG-L family deacetylase n=1 Tax=Inquilinus sp. CAU 1745 TaxID=3140369 RepID=UPI00325C14BE
MPSDRERLARRMGDPALVRLHRKLERLRSVVTIMNTGAHPDDEFNNLLAALRFGMGMRIVIGCSTRGEGGQNGIGPERGAALGVLRTRELEEAARVLDASIAWLGHGPADPVHDFGFSKNGDDTLARWGEDRIVERLVRAYRTERPDIVLPTFLDVPGQHGHHRAMTRAAESAIALAADPAAYPDHAAEGLRPWRVAKFYLPAWSGAGGSYDDEEPPPPATLTVEAPGRDRATGAAFGQIGEWSRSFHRCQGMGVWRNRPPACWPLHLRSGGAESDIRDGLPADIRALGGLDGVSAAAASAFTEAQAAIDRALAAFPDREAIILAATEAAEALEQVETELPEAIGHRISRKRRELDAVIIEAAGVAIHARAQPVTLAPGQSGDIHVVIDREADDDIPVAVDLSLTHGLSVAERSEGADESVFQVASAPDAAFTSPYPAAFDPLGGNGDAFMNVAVDIGGRTARGTVDPEEPLRIAPARSVAIEPQAVIVNLAQPARSTDVALRLEGGAGDAEISWTVPEGFSIEAEDGNKFRLWPEGRPAGGGHRLTPTIDGDTAFRVTPIAYPHIGRTAHVREEALDVLVLEAVIPEGVRVGYVGGGNDHVGVWLDRLGIDVTDLDSETLLNGDLSRFTTIIVGIFAFGTRPDLAAARPRLHRWVEEGGHLVTLYHRPGDGWDPSATPPRLLRIGSPSLRWRVTDPAAEIRPLAPDHPLLTTPNAIGPEDWSGWDKERGLYFASEWDPVYRPLLSINDAGEKPLEGALVSAEIGHGRHTHVSLVLHHQLDRLVPGAFRLLANLMQPA